MPLLISTFAIAAVAASLADPPVAAALQLRIAVIADTQQQTTRSLACRSRPGGALDKFEGLGAACRPVASEHLALASLNAILRRSRLEKPDFGLYLGDAANHGCADEVDAVLGALRRAPFPVFFVPGNHDLLAAGNYARVGKRERTCGTRSNALGKGALRDRTMAHNEDQFARLADRGLAPTRLERRSEGATCEVGRDAMTSAECGFSMWFSVFKSNQEFVIQLTDANDYFVERGRASGVRGWRGFVSDAQSTAFGDHFDSRIDTAEAEMRARPVLIAAAHYDLMSLRPAGSDCWRPSAKTGWIGKHSGLPGKNEAKWPAAAYWLSAHTHVAEPQVCAPNVIIDDKKEVAAFCEINVGSTTDWIPHGAVLDLAPCEKDSTNYSPASQCVGEGEVKIVQLIEGADALAVWTEIQQTVPVADLTVAGCVAPKLAACDGDPTVDAARQALADAPDLACRLGLSLDYRDATSEQVDAMRANIDAALARTSDRTVWRAALAYLAAATEGAHAPQCGRCPPAPKVGEAPRSCHMTTAATVAAVRRSP